MPRRVQRFRYAGRPRPLITGPEEVEEQRVERRSEQRVEQRDEQRVHQRKKRRSECPMDRTRPSQVSENLSDTQSIRRFAFTFSGAECLKDPDNVLACLTVLSMLLGLSAGLLIRLLQPTKLTIMLIGLPGDLLMRMLKLLMLPLVVTSLVAGFSSLNVRSSGKIGVVTLVYFFMTSWAAVMLGVMLVLAIHPGDPKIKNQVSTFELDMKRSNRTLDNVLDLIRNLFPDNLVQAVFQQTLTNFVAEDEQQFSNSDTKLTDSSGMNMLGLICVSAFFGLVIRSMGDTAQKMVRMFCAMNSTIMKMVRIMIWYSPIGIFSLITNKILAMDDFVATVRSLGLYVITVSVGLALHMCLIQALSYLALTRKNPITFFCGVFQAWVTALGTASSAATLPITFRCLEENLRIDRRITRFVLPIGANVNMNGAALYEAVSGIFIAQVNGVEVGALEVIVVSLTSTLAAVGAASLPSGGLVTMALVVSALGLPVGDVSLVMNIDWLLDLQCTAVNIMGDAFCAGILDHILRSQSSRTNKSPGSRSPTVVKEVAIDRTQIAPVDIWLAASSSDEEAEEQIIQLYL